MEAVSTIRSNTKNSATKPRASSEPIVVGFGTQPAAGVARARAPVVENNIFRSADPNDIFKADRVVKWVTELLPPPTRRLSEAYSDGSVKSVSSVQVVGGLEFGSLRVHSVPSSPPIAHMATHEALMTGDIILIQDVPRNTVFGYDVRSFTIQDDSFKGIKEVPKGVHFVWGGSGDSSRRTGFWLISEKKGTTEYGDIVVKKWDAEQEVLMSQLSVAEVRIQQSNVPEIIDQLHPYDAVPASASGGVDITTKYPNIWFELTSSIKHNMLSRITGNSDWNDWYVSTTHDYKEAQDTEKTLAFTVSGNDEVLTFIFPKDTKTFSTRALGRERTNQVMDTTAHILSIIENYCLFEDSDEIIGELQFCYITGMVLGNASCLEHWGHIVKTMFKAFNLTLDASIFFAKFIKAVHAQLKYDNVGIEGSIFDHDNSLSHDLKIILIKFKSEFDERFICQKAEYEDLNAVKRAFEDFESFLWNYRGGWDLRGNFVRSGKIQLEDGEFVDAETTDFEAEDERGEFAPAIVELDEDGREKGLIKF